MHRFMGWLVGSSWVPHGFHDPHTFLTLYKNTSDLKNTPYTINSTSTHHLFFFHPFVYPSWCSWAMKRWTPFMLLSGRWTPFRFQRVSFFYGVSFVVTLPFKTTWFFPDPIGEILETRWFFIRTANAYDHITHNAPDSRPISEVNMCWACSVLGWGTAREL